MILTDKTNTKRLLIYFFYDREGIVDGYIDHIMGSLKPFVSEILVVCNGLLSNEGRKVFEQYSDNIIVRENKGFDVWAYKAALDYYDKEGLAKFDEIILMNFTIMGPVISFEDMFVTMDKKDVDFWGITICHEVGFDPFDMIEYGYIPTHIQSHFIAIRSSMFNSDNFYHYWNSRPMINSYNESVAKHEVVFTKKFEDMGYRWASYVDTRDILDYTFYPLMFAPTKLIKERDCPIFKRRGFICDYYSFLDNNNGESSIELYEYLRDKTSYDVNMIWDNILRSGNQYDIKNCLHLNYIVPSDVYKATTKRRLKSALMMHIYFEDLILYCYDYAKSMPEDAYIYITTDSENKAIAIKNVFCALPNNVTVLTIPNVGRDVSSLLVALRNYVHMFDVICFAHDKKVAQLYFKIKGESFSYLCFENILKNNIFVENVLTVFAENPRLGLLTPPPPEFAEYFPTVSGYGWGDNFEGSKAFFQKMNINLEIDFDKEPIAPYGTMFWFRVKALKPLFDMELKYEDFPIEPIATNGTILHIIERAYAIVSQASGYYPAWVMSDSFARIELTNKHYMLTQINRAVFSLVGGPNTYSETLNRLKVKDLNIAKVSVNTFIIYKLKHSLKGKHPKLYVFLRRIYNKFLKKV